MTELSAFTQSFARLVWLSVHRPADEAARAPLLGLLAEKLQAGRIGESIVLADLSLHIAGAFEAGELAEDIVWLSELSVRMAAHSVRALRLESGLSPEDLGRLATAFAAAPQPGDEGEGFDRAVQQLGSPHVVAHIGRHNFVRRATPAMGAGIVPARTPAPPAPPAAAPGRPTETPAPGAPSVVPAPTAASEAHRVTDETAAIIRSELAGSSGRVPLGDLVERLREAPGRPVGVEEVRGAVHDAEDRAREGLWVDVAVVLDRLHRSLETVSDGELRRAYLAGIRRLETPENMRGLTALLPRRRELRALVTALLARAGHVGADALLDALVKSDVTVERRAYRTALAQCPAAVPDLLHLLSDDRWYVVRNAVELLGELRPPDADARIAEVLGHQESRVRRAAVLALARLATQRATLALLQALHDAAPEVRMQAALALGAVGSPRAVPWLLEALDGEADAEVQRAILAALGRLPTDDAVARLIRVAESHARLARKRTPLRVQAVQALAEADTPAAKDALRRLEEDRSEAVRAAVARSNRRRPATDL